MAGRRRKRMERSVQNRRERMREMLEGKKRKRQRKYVGG